MVTNYMSIDTAVIIAGGLGTRLYPLTKEIPKPLIPIRGVTLTEHVIGKIKEAGVKTVYASIGYMSEKIIRHFSTVDTGTKLNFIVEKEALGTGGWMKLLSEAERKTDFSKTFIVVNGDNLFDLDWARMYDMHQKSGALITIGLTSMPDPTAYGVARLKENRIEEFVEKPTLEQAPSHMINTGYYIFNPDIFNFLPTKDSFMLEKDVFPRIASMGRLYGYIDQGQWFDTGTFERWDTAIKEWRIK
jgi:NDP-sugar pyrophosphorylase family protein